MKTLLLLDGSSYLYRAYHALPDLRTAAGEPTGALRGFISMLRTLRQQVPADYLACVFDAKGKTFRDDLYAEYKANRAAMPEDLVAQIAPIHAAARALGWPVIEIEGIEADDVIGTLARYAAQHGLRTVISTGDKDLAQLVDEHTTLVNTMSGETLDVPGVEAKFGVPPTRIVDYLTLVGDSVDNVPGVEKVGPKTAAKWLQAYGSLDAVVERAGEIGGVVGDNLRKALPWLPTARTLVTVKTDCDLAPHVPDLAALAMREEDPGQLREIYGRYEFKSWLREVGQTAAADPPAATRASESSGRGRTSARVRNRPDARTARCLAAAHRRRRADLRRHRDDVARSDGGAPGGPVAVDRAAAGLLYPAGTQLRRRAGTAAVRRDARGAASLAGEPAPPQGGAAPEVRHACVRQPRAEARRRGARHAARVLRASRRIAATTWTRWPERHLGRKTITFAEVCGKGANQLRFDEVALDRATEYAAEDAEVTLALHHALWPHIEPNEKLRSIYQDIELPVAQVLFEMERTGVLIDRAKLEAQSAELARRIAELERQAAELAGQPFNLGSPKQIGEILFGQLKLPVVKKTASGAPSTDEEVLEKLAEDYPLPKVLLEHRGLAKLKSTYCDKLPASADANGRVHTTYGQAIAVTGRLSSSDPNLQNIPIRTAEGRRIREAFIAPPGHQIVSADYSQIELRIMAHISEDAGLLDAFSKGEDIHRATASEVFGVPVAEVTSEQRRYAKVINFGLIYGMSAFGLAGNLGIEREAARSYIDRYFMRYPGVAKYMEHTRALAKRQGYVETVFGRRLWLPRDQFAQRTAARRRRNAAAINAPMQGTAADLIKLAMIAVARWIAGEALGTRLVMQVHDELVLEVPDAEVALVRERVPALMAGVAQLRVPLVADVGVGDNWDQAH